MNWIIFVVLIVSLLALDLGVFNKKSHVFSFKEATLWSIFWVGLSCIFGIFVYFYYGHDAGNQWFTAYVLEKSLSVDNLFVMYLIFNYFCTPPKLQHRALFWGIVGAIVLRAIFIIGGVAIINQFGFIMYFFGALLVYSGIKLLFAGEEEQTIEKNAVVKWFEKHFRVYGEYDGDKFITKKPVTSKITVVTQNGVSNLVITKRMFTLLFIVLLMIETSDIMFAVDSIPAAFGVSNNAFVLYTSNIFAVLGLRALYFVLVSMIDKFWALKYGISSVLVFIGAKMLIKHWIEIPTNVSLLVVLLTLGLSIMYSLVKQKH